MKQYDPKKIEPKWQAIWEETEVYKTEELPGRENYYALVMFPYPSGDLHAGHWYNFGPGDTHARFMRMQGRNVLHPFGFDAFGLPAENAAIKRNIPPAQWTEQNIASMTKQVKAMGTMYDWDKLVVTSEPDYYRWTQWLFLELYEKGLAYRAKGIQNWCPKDQTVLANEQTISESGEKGVCVRCGTKVVKKELEQWFFRITDYADRLLTDLDKVEWPHKVKTMQENWIGRSEGAEIEFKLRNVAGQEDNLHSFKVFTTRPDTLAGATFVVISPELALQWLDIGWKASDEVRAYLDDVARETNLDRQIEDRLKTGVDTGMKAVNPLTNEEVPVWLSDYVLGGYGTGAIMAVPAHDERDGEFAKKFGLPIKEVVSGGNIQEEAFAGEGKLINSGQFDGMESKAAQRAIIEHLYANKQGKGTTNYKLRDWLISRQRYWGAPIPIIYCDDDGAVPVPAKDLPVVLPLDVEFEPTGKSPLAARPDFYETTCPKCGKPARRETDTMDTFVDSSWYFLRYPNTQYDEGAFDPEAVKRWLPVDQYMGGIEHAILHLLYARFITKVLYDQKLISFDEPFKKLFNQGIILGPDGQKMSKSRGNVVNPDEWVAKYGADTFRTYLMFMGPYDQGGPFDTSGISGTHRFLGRAWTLVEEFVSAGKNSQQAMGNGVLETAMVTATHKTIRKVTQDIQNFGFNTAIASLMELVNDLYKFKLDLPFSSARETWEDTLATLLKLLAPFAPHLAEELWNEMGGHNSIHVELWPAYREDLVREDLVEIAVQVNGKLRGTVELPVASSEDDLKAAAAKVESVQKHLEGKEIVKTIVVPRRLVNFVVK
jgi:leucyl-tRNA synthetase